MPAVITAPPLSRARTFVLHLWAFVLPLITLAFWLTGPHGIIASLLWTMPIWILVYIDNRAPADKRQPPEPIPNWPFDLQVYALFALQITNYVLLGVTAARIHFDGWLSVAQAAAMIVPVIVLAGTNAGYSGIVVAHELVHRRNPVEFAMGRLLLVGVLYEQFATEHVRGHHPRVGTLADPATARFGEDHRTFVRRTIRAQFKSAWQLENVRLQLQGKSVFHPRRLRHRVLQGVLAELVVLVAYSYYFGPLALVYFLLQSRAAVFLLETVNYIEHWGLARAGKKVVSADSWDTDNWFTLYTLVGLSRHADHHAQASRPYQRLRHFDETAKMPAGYYGTILMAMIDNARYQSLATAELRAKQLGPFRRGDSVEPGAHTHPSLRAAARDEALNPAPPAS